MKGGTDLVGDAYDASSDDPAINTPVPDPNPLDCNGHGSHVAGSAAGFGVTAQRDDVQRPYDQNTHSNFAFSIGPGVAPRADLYAVSVFGCEGSTDVVTEALDWAVDNDMDVVNMSLGADFGSAGFCRRARRRRCGQSRRGRRHFGGQRGRHPLHPRIARHEHEEHHGRRQREGRVPIATVNMALPAIPAGPAAKTIQRDQRQRRGVQSRVAGTSRCCAMPTAP